MEPIMSSIWDTEHDFTTDYVNFIEVARNSLLTAAGSANSYDKWTNVFVREELKRSILRSQALICCFSRVDGVYQNLRDGRYYSNEALQAMVDPDLLLPLPDKFLTKSGEKAFGHTTLSRLGFGMWDSNLYLIPLWMVPLFNPKSIVEDIGGQKSELGSLDTDHRGGLVAGGFRI
jgi:hypothetical protein